MEIVVQIAGLALGFLFILLYFIIEEATKVFTEKLTWSGIMNTFSAFPLSFLTICIFCLGALYVALYILEDII